MPGQQPQQSAQSQRTSRPRPTSGESGEGEEANRGLQRTMDRPQSEVDATLPPGPLPQNDGTSFCCLPHRTAPKCSTSSRGSDGFSRAMTLAKICYQLLLLPSDRGPTGFPSHFSARRRRSAVERRPARHPVMGFSDSDSSPPDTKH